MKIDSPAISGRAHYRRGAVFSRRLSKIPFLSAFLPEVDRISGAVSAMLGKPDCVIGWGLKETARRAREYAAGRSLPYLALEDGFLRSCGLGVEGVPPLSLVVDPIGIYYDARKPSYLEVLLENGGWETDEILARASRNLRWIVDERLSKYNVGDDCLSPVASERRRILVVDQTVGDASVAGGCADPETFVRMLETAIGENPDAEIVIKIHPDVVTGRKRGYLSEIAPMRGFSLVGEGLSPWAVLDGVDEVYTVSSQLGFEALMAGKTVRCFGIPFYAGWGLTRDELPIKRRSRRRSLEEVFAAAYMVYARYVNPFTGAASSLEDTIGLLGDLNRRRRQVSRGSVCVGFSPWKKRFLPAFLAPESDLPRFVDWDAADLAQAPRLRRRIVVWSSKMDDEFDRVGRSRGLSLVRVEDGFLRSVGLGVDLVRPWSLVLDTKGIHYDPRYPSDLEEMIQQGGFPTGLLERAARLRRSLVQTRITKYNLPAERPHHLPGFRDGQARVLVPGQVEDDASVRIGSPVVSTNLDLLKAVRRAVPGAYIVYKPHPDVDSGLRPGRVDDAAALAWCDRVVRGGNVVDLIDWADEIHTMTSLTGFEALLRGKAVAVYGAPFYGGWGLTTDRIETPRRTRKASLDELVAAALILYPRYQYWPSGLPCRAEDVVEILRQGASESLLRHCLRLLFRGIRR